MSNALHQLQQLYKDYISQAYTARVKAPFAAGFLSSHKDPGLHPCHEAFYNAAGDLITQYTVQPDDEPEQLLRWILQTPESYTDHEAYWYLIAVQTHAKQLIPLLPEAVRHSIGTWYASLAPKRKRFPVQDEILHLLQK